METLQPPYRLLARYQSIADSICGLQYLDILTVRPSKGRYESWLTG